MKKIVVYLCLILMWGCAKKDSVSFSGDMSNTQTKNIAKELAKNFLEEFRMKDEKYVISLSDINNQSDQDIDVEIFGRTLVREIRKNTKVMFVNSIARSAGKKDEMLDDVRSLRSQKEFNQDAVVKEGQLIAPNLSLSGKIIQKNTNLDKNRIKKEYVFLITITSIETGLVLWDKDVIITQVTSVKEDRQRNSEVRKNETRWEPKKENYANQDKNNYLLIGMDFGGALGQTPEQEKFDENEQKKHFNAYYGGKLGYHGSWSDVSFSMYGMYQYFISYVGSDDDDKDDEDDRRRDSSIVKPYREKSSHQFGLGATLAWKFLYLGGGAFVSLKDKLDWQKNLYPFAETGIVMYLKNIGLNLGVRYYFDLKDPEKYKNENLVLTLGLLYRL